MHTYIHTYIIKDFFHVAIDKNASLYVIFHDLSYGGNVPSASFSLQYYHISILILHSLSPAVCARLYTFLYLYCSP